jgi:hypothetical protein
MFPSLLSLNIYSLCMEGINTALLYSIAGGQELIKSYDSKSVVFSLYYFTPVDLFKNVLFDLYRGRCWRPWRGWKRPRLRSPSSYRKQS